jgi:hypothetical protein
MVGDTVPVQDHERQYDKNATNAYWKAEPNTSDIMNQCPKCKGYKEPANLKTIECSDCFDPNAPVMTLEEVLLSTGDWVPVEENTPKGPSRNKPCWCGSGKNYKNCHGKNYH